MKESVAPRSIVEGVPSIAKDTSVWLLTLVNVGALIAAVVLDWHLIDLMAVYWAQSVVIGVSYFGRIINLEKFSTENFRINNRAVEPTRQTKLKTASFFVMHFGCFHLAYLIFIFAEAPNGFQIGLGLVTCSLAFACNHFFSYRYHRELDRQGTPNIGTLMFTPYLRVIPMHLTVVFGAVAMESAGVLIFGLLKAVADIGMHLIEHQRLSGLKRS
jgi:hypothetical protein